MIKIVLLFAISFTPPIIYAAWIRNTEKYERESWKAILTIFIWGATVAIIAALFLEILLGISISASIHDYTLSSFIMATVIAPFAEEIAKPIGISLKNVRKEINEKEDGIIYGAVAGLGFSATENLFYSISFLSYGWGMFLLLVFIRTIGGCLLHASATALTGYGYGKMLLEKRGFAEVLPFFIMAMFVHSFYNLLVSSGETGGIFGIILAMVFAIVCMGYIRKKIKMLDRSTSL